MRSTLKTTMAAVVAFLSAVAMMVAAMTAAWARAATGAAHVREPEQRLLPAELFQVLPLAMRRGRGRAA